MFEKIGVSEVTKHKKIINNSLKCRKDTENINPKVLSTSNGKAMILSECAMCGNKKSRSIENQEAKGLLSNLGLRAPLNKVPLLGDILF